MKSRYPPLVDMIIFMHLEATGQSVCDAMEVACPAHTYTGEKFMKTQQHEAILITYFKERVRYELLAEAVVHLIKDDPSSPKDSLHTILYRIKNKERLLEKIDELNKVATTEAERVTEQNLKAKIGDLLGIRLICLRLSDIKRMESYLKLLVEEKSLNMLDRPKHKKSFVLPVESLDTAYEGSDIRYSGYSSIHYQMTLGENSDAPEDLQELRFELQLRTILEEAWGEIDHKYRYVYSRSGEVFPEYIHEGFFNLSTYLQAAALQAEYLCRQVEAHRQSKRNSEKSDSSRSTATHGLNETYLDEFDQQEPPAALQQVLQQTFGFKPTAKTIAYVVRRLAEFGTDTMPENMFAQLFTAGRAEKFKEIFHEVLDHEPYVQKNKRNIDLINAVNFALFDTIQGSKVAQEGLKSVLRWRKGH